MNRRTFGRRRFLESLGVGGVAFSPVLRSLTAQAAGTAPTRLAVVFSPIGTIAKNFFPTTAGPLPATLPMCLEPFKDLKDDILIVKGLDNRSNLGESHVSAAGGALTGAARGKFYAGTSGKAYAGGPSIDQVVGAKLQGSMPFASLLFGWQSKKHNAPGVRPHLYVSYRAASEPLTAEDSPAKMFETLMPKLRPSGSQPGDAAATEALRAQGRSQFDFWSNDLKRIRQRLGGLEKDKFEAFEDVLRDVERGISAIGGALRGNCTDLGVTKQESEGANEQKVAELQMTLAAQSLACGFAPVSLVMLGCENSAISYPWLSVGSHHPTSHNGGTDGQMAKISQWKGGLVAGMLRKLKSIPEPGGTALSNTLVLWTYGMGYGYSHSNKNIGVLVAGRAGGKVKPGRTLAFSGISNANLLVAVGNAVGVPMETFGNPAWCDSPFSLG